MITKDEVVKLRQRLYDAGFTRSQVDVLSCLAEGKSNREIGSSLFVTEKAVKYHMTNLFKKLSVSGRHEVLKRVVTIVKG
jgi:DNA-binding NarL/FixJ family response regulator